METFLLKAGKNRDQQKAANLIKSGGIVAFATETVYGLGVLGLKTKQLEKIYSVKNRPKNKPISLQIFDISWSKKLWLPKKEQKVQFWNRFNALAKAFWPGSLTIIGYKSKIVPEICSKNGKIALRIPSNKEALLLLQETNEPLAVSSANISGEKSLTKAQDVFKSLSGRIDAVLDCGKCKIGIESTVIDITTQKPCILRQGYISKQQIENVLTEKVAPFMDKD